MYWNLPGGDTRLAVLGRDIKYISRLLSHLLYKKVTVFNQIVLLSFLCVFAVDSYKPGLPYLLVMIPLSDGCHRESSSYRDTSILDRRKTHP
jgi:hypothetical protein